MLFPGYSFISLVSKTSFLCSVWILFLRSDGYAPARENLVVLLRAYTWVLFPVQRNRRLLSPTEVLVSIEGKTSAEAWAANQVRRGGKGI